MIGYANLYWCVHMLLFVFPLQEIAGAFFSRQNCSQIELLEMCIKVQVCKCMCMCTVVCCLYIWWNPHIRGACRTVILPKTKILCTFFVQFHFVCFVSHISVFVHLFVCLLLLFLYIIQLDFFRKKFQKQKNIVFNMHILGRSALW